MLLILPDKALHFLPFSGLIDFPLVMVANLTRICALYFIGSSAPRAFEFAHREVFPLLLVLMASAFFLAWARSARPRVAGRPGPGAWRASALPI